MDMIYTTLDRFLEIGSYHYFDLMDSLPNIYDSEKISLRNKLYSFGEYSLFKKDLERVSKLDSLSTRQKALLSDFQLRINETDKKLRSRLEESIEDVLISLDQERTKNYYSLFRQFERVRDISYSLGYYQLSDDSIKQLSTVLKKKLFLEENIEFYSVHAERKKGLVITYTNKRKELQMAAKHFLKVQKKGIFKMKFSSMIKTSLIYSSIFALGVFFSHNKFYSSENKSVKQKDYVILSHGNPTEKLMAISEKQTENPLVKKTNVGNNHPTNARKFKHTDNKKTSQDKQTITIYNWIDRGGK
jgi:flavodoxin